MPKLRHGTKVDSSKLRTKITEDIYKDNIGYYYRCGDSIINCWIFNCKLCSKKTANCNQAHTCAGCTRIYNQGYRNYRKGGSLLYVPNDNLRILTNGTEYRGVCDTYMHKMFKHKCDKCNTDSLYSQPHTPARCHYCYYLKRGGTPHVEKAKALPIKQQQLTFSSSDSEVFTPIKDSTPVKYIDGKEDRHQMFFNLFNDMISKGGMQRKLNGAILSLPSEYPWADKGRIDHFFHDPTEYLWYENQPGKLRSVNYIAKQLNKIMVNSIAYRVYDTDIMKSRHTNVGLANLDLECTMSPTLMEDAYEVIKAGLIGRKRIGFTLNTYGRGPKNMTLDKRDSLWNGLLNRFINDGHSIKYTSGRLGYTSGIGSTMFLFGAVIEQ